MSTGIPHLFREDGAFYTPTRRWLTAESPGKLPGAAQLLARLHTPSFTLVSLTSGEAPARLGPYRREGATRLVALFSGDVLHFNQYAQP